MMTEEEHEAFLARLRDLCVGATVVSVSRPEGESILREDYFTMTVERNGERKTFTFGATELGCWVTEHE